MSEATRVVPVLRSLRRPSRPFGILLLLLAALLILITRRPDQFLAPYVWNEEGHWYILQYLEHGLGTLFVPVQGYLQFSSKTINVATTLISFYHYPEVSYALTLLLTLGVVLAIALAPTELRWRPACALLALLIPTDPEVFGVPLYSFWWAGLLVVLALVWNWQGQRSGLRAGFLVFGGLSTPVVVSLLPLFWLRAAIARSRMETGIAVLASLVAAVQLGFILGGRFTPAFGGGEAGLALGYEQLSLFANKFLGFFLFLSLDHRIAIATGTLLLGGLLALFCLDALRRRDVSFLLLTGALAAAALSSALRHPKLGINPVEGGPRYFFFPYVLLFWLLATAAATQPRLIRLVAMAMICIALLNALPVYRRHHDTLDWRIHIDRCLADEKTEIPIHRIGDARKVRTLTLSRAQCRDLVSGSLFGPQL